MLENQFIQFAETIPPTGEDWLVPTIENEEISFFVYAQEGVSIDIVTPDGAYVIEDGAIIDVHSTADPSYQQVLLRVTENIAVYDKFRVRMTADTTHYSNLMVRMPGNMNLSSLQYSCKEEAFELPFGYDASRGGYPYLKQTMPIRIYNQQFKQEDKIYTKRTGENVVLYASINVEYSGETDYIPIEWHEKIVYALSCDDVLINGKKVTKSDNYEVDHDNYTYSDSGVKLLRATFKVKENITKRNSNY